MANMTLPYAERNLSPDEVESLDRRRRRGQFFLVLGFQFGIIATLMTIWSGQDITLSPGWHHPIAYWDALAFAISGFSLITGIRLRRGMNEFMSY